MFAKFVLALGALVAFFIGYMALSNPAGVLTDYGVIVSDANGRNEIRGQYGGYFIVLAGVMIASLLGKLPQKFGLGVFMMTVGGILLGRIASLIIEGPAVFATYSPGIKALLAIDLTLTLLAFFAMRSIKKD